MTQINLGARVRDTHTGYTGLLTARTESLYGCTRLCIEGDLDKDGRVPASQWFDEPRIVEATDYTGRKTGFKP